MRNRTSHGKKAAKTGSNPPGTPALTVVPAVSAKTATALSPPAAGGAPTNAAGPQIVESLAHQIDRLGYYRAALADYAAKAAPMKAAAEALERKILARHGNLAADEIAIAEGERYTLKIGAQAEEQSVVPGGLKQVFRWVGADKFIERAKVTLETLKGLLTPEQYAEVVEKKRTGRRNLTVTAKLAAADLPPVA